MKSSRSRFLEVRGVRYHVREWGREGAPRLFLLHGWMDVSASFQFIVDALEGDWHVIAPDWRGFGLSQWCGDAYWFPDYFADLDAILEQLQPSGEVRLGGHSLGGNVALMYAGIRPSRVGRVVVMDGFGLVDRSPEEAPGRYEKWLHDLRSPAQFRPYADFDALAARLCRDNPRLSAEHAVWLARHLGEDDGQGGIRLAGDPAHRRVNPVLYRRAESEACWRRVSAPVLWLEPDDQSVRHRIGVNDESYESAKACLRDVRVATITDAGHNLHHDQPQQVAGIIEAFLRSEHA
ncbi:MAG: alpha/beta hydrolase [Azoarcus sp.]|nr:MAG: alpha/beta hydrolase [Azoarcus sp.]